MVATQQPENADMKRRNPVGRYLCILSVSLAIAVAIAALQSGAAAAQSYPSRPVRLIVPAAAGGGLDVLARIMAQRVSEIWNQQLFVENKPGANFIIGMDAVAKAEPDGYTLLFVSSAGLTINPVVFAKLPLDPMRDLKPVTITTSNPFVLLVNSSVPAKSVQELVAYLKANPGKLNHASNSASTMLVSELFKARAGVDYTDINFRGGGPAIISTEAGDTQLCFVDLASATAALSSDRVRVLAVTTADRYNLRPDLPTLAEGGVAGYSAAAWGVVLAPARTPAEIIARINNAFREALKSPQLIERIHAVGNEVVGSSQEEALNTLGAEADQWSNLVRERHIQLMQ
jgi:tripartite-type tricarboxylate transporter receptor subunit TctC